MKAFIVMSVLIVAAYAGDQQCSNDIKEACKPGPSKSYTPPSQCNAKYGAIDGVLSSLQSYANNHIASSFEYLLMSTHYANYEKSRAGFEKLFRDLSDSKWNTAIDLMKYITKRGGEMKFIASDIDNKSQDIENYELQSLAKSLDIEKAFAVDAENIHKIAARQRQEYHDPEIISFIEEKFSHQQAGLIRKLSGYITDLTQLLDHQRGTSKSQDKVLNDDASLSLHFFDEYLLSQ